LGEVETSIDYDTLAERSITLHQKLVPILTGFETWDMKALIQKRAELIRTLQEDFSSNLAETRIPANDVSLWQHCYSTAAIFKAMLARHFILDNFCAWDDNPDALSYYIEKLAFIGVRWSEDQIFARSVRPRDMLGRRARLYDLTEKLKEEFEVISCIGNEVYRDRNGICFLVPDLESMQHKVYQNLIAKLHVILNSELSFPGDLNYRILFKPVGIQILGFSDLLMESIPISVTIMDEGPKKPEWINKWGQEVHTHRLEICSRCGLRPVELRPTAAGAEQEEARLCEFCEKLGAEGSGERYRSAADSRLWLPRLEEGCKYFCYETDKMTTEANENSRLALIQGTFDLRPYLSGEAFSSILSKNPAHFTGDTGINDRSQSIPINTWNDMYHAAESSFKQMNSNGHINESVFHTFQQVFVDSRLGTTGDGRVPGQSNEEKLKNYIRQMVLTSPFPKHFNSDIQKIVTYALRQHPASSRIGRVWETTERFCRNTVSFCEEQKIPYFPISVDPGRFLILIPAFRAWEFVQAMYSGYSKMAGRVRHLLPFHLSVAIFYKKFPLYVGIDAMRRFTEIQTQKSDPQLWEIQENKDKGQFCRLKWKDRLGRNVIWNVPKFLYNGGQDDYFSWFWVEGEERPFHVSELQSGQKAFVHPSSFDYEVLDTTTRRYDIRLGETGFRPHLFCGDKGPRPFPLENLETWKGIREHLKTIDPHQISRLTSLLGEIHQNWNGSEKEVFRKQVKDYLSLCLKQSSDELTEMAVTGELFDIIEWHHLISK
jgi:hypothetical protein